MLNKGDSVVFILNPNAGTGNSDLEKKISKTVSDMGYTPIVELSKSEIDSQKIIDDYWDLTGGLFLAVGGDGTMNSVASILLERDGTVGIIPAGSGNGLSRFLGIPMKTENAVKKVLTSKPHYIDIWKINNHIFLNVAGIGFDAEVARLFGGRTKRGFWGYARLVTSTLFKYKPSIIKISQNGNTIQNNYFIVSMFNGSQYGNNTVLAPEAKIDDGLLDLVGVPKMNNLLLIENLLRSLLTNKGLKNITYEKMNKIKIEVEDALPIHIDGEYKGYFNEVIIEKENRKLKILF